MSTNRSLTKTGSLSRVSDRSELWDYDESWADRETDLKKLRSQIKIMARQLRQYDDIDKHNRAENFRLRQMVDPFFDPELTIGEQIDLNAMVEERVVAWLRNKGYHVESPWPDERREAGGRTKPQPRRGRVALEDRSGRKRS